MKFADIVKQLVKILKTGKMGEDYLDLVREKIIGSKINLGYKIKQVIGVGNLGTTV